jgi:hypothetical protein
LVQGLVGGASPFFFFSYLMARIKLEAAISDGLYFSKLASRRAIS